MNVVDSYTELMFFFSSSGLYFSDLKRTIFLIRVLDSWFMVDVSGFDPALVRLKVVYVVCCRISFHIFG